MRTIIIRIDENLVVLEKFHLFVYARVSSPMLGTELLP